jgi:replicative DNA helicase
MSAFPNIDGDIERPVSIHAEMTILGAMLVEPTAIDDAMKLLREDDFVLDSHRRIYSAITRLAKDGWPVDIITATNLLTARKHLHSVGGLPYIASLSEGLPRRLSIESYVRIVRDKSLMRRAMNICDRALVRMQDTTEEAMVIISDTEAELAKAGEEVQVEGTLEQQSEEEFELLERQRTGEVKVFATSGLEVWDEWQGGYAIGELTVIGARPRVGKSTLLRQGIIANCEAGDFVHYFSAEMRAGQILRCLWAAIACIPFHKVRHPERMNAIERGYLEAAKKAVAAFPLQIDDSSPISAPEIIARGRRVKRKHNTKLFAVDYLQKLRHKGRSQDRHVEVTDAVVSFASFAKNENVAFVLISSLTENNPKERNSPPTIDDFRQSGDIKFEANTAILMHREIDMESAKLSPETRLIVGKARSDEDGARKVFLNGQMQVFLSEDVYMRGIGA